MKTLSQSKIIRVFLILITLMLGISQAQGQALDPLRDASYIDVLRNTTYVGIYGVPITLKNGYYEGSHDSADDSAGSQVTLLERLMVRGKLSEGGVEHTVVLLEKRGGGTGSFLYLAVMAEVEGVPVSLASTLIGDRIPVRNLSISGEDNQIILDIVIEGPGDAACCKFTKARQVLQLQDDFLATLSLEEQGRVSLADIEGVTWLLREIGPGESPLKDVPVTLTFEAGRVFGSAGCNQFQATYEAQNETEIPVDLVMGPILTTRKMCEPLVMAQEDEFLAKLQGLADFGFLLGDLRFSYLVEGQYGAMVFEQQVVPASLTDTAWQWLYYEDPVDGRTDIADPANSRLTFGIDGQLELMTDCLTANLPYTVQGSSLMIDTSSLDLSSCSADSASLRLGRDLEYVRIFSLNEGRLLLDLLADGGTLVFEQAPFAVTTTEQDKATPPEPIEVRLDTDTVGEVLSS